MVLPVRTAEDIVRMRQAIRERAIALGFSLVDQTKVVTAASELARNILNYGGEGSVTMEQVASNGRNGLKLLFSDDGPGIPDIELAMKDGYSTGAGMGLGLGGAKRLSNEFSIDTQVGKGTRITIVRWNR